MSETIEENEFFGLTPDSFARYCESYGELNPKAILYLRENYDTEEAYRALRLMESAHDEIASLSHQVCQFYTAARDIIDEDTCALESYNLAESGELRWRVSELRDQLSHLGNKLETVSGLLAPLERLTPVDEEMTTKDGMYVAYDEKDKKTNDEDWPFDF